MNVYEQIENNKFKSRLVMVIFVAILLALGAGLDYYFGLGIRYPVFSLAALGISAFSAYFTYAHGERMLLASVHARPLNFEDVSEKQWRNIVEEVSIAAGIAVPRTYIIDDEDPNAFAAGKDPASSCIVATRGLLDVLDRRELQGVAAHEISHIKNYDVRLMLVVTVLLGSIALISDWAGRALFYSRREERKDKSSAGIFTLVVWIAAVILAPLISRIIAMCISRRREYLADASASEISRDPLALASALEKIDSRSAATKAFNHGNAHLWISDPKGSSREVKDGGLSGLFATHPPVKKRVEALKNMAYVK